MNLIIRDVVCDEYNYTVSQLIASTVAVFVLPLDCACTRAHVVDGYDDQRTRAYINISLHDVSAFEFRCIGIA